MSVGGADFDGLVCEHFAAFAERMAEGGRSLPRYVIEEFESLLRCGCRARRL